MVMSLKTNTKCFLITTLHVSLIVEIINHLNNKKQQTDLVKTIRIERLRHR